MLRFQIVPTVVVHGTSFPLLASSHSWNLRRELLSKEIVAWLLQHAALIQTCFKFTGVKNGFASYCEFKYLQPRNKRIAWLIYLATIN